MGINHEKKGEGFSIKADLEALAIREALKTIRMYDGKTRLGLERAINNGIKRMAASAKRRVLVGRGTLKKSIFSSFRKYEYYTRGPVGYFGAKAPHAHLIEKGVAKSEVKPDRKKALRITGKNIVENASSMVIFAARATIPSRRGRPFIEPAYEEERLQLIRDIKKAAQP